MVAVETPSKARIPTLGGVAARQVIEVRPLQPEKAHIPMLVTLLGMVIEVRLLQPENAELPMLVTSSPISTVLI
jgi:hypothetical protein